MMNKLVHRGPDEDGFFVSEEDNIAFGHKRLSIIDIDGGKQPFISNDGNFIITYNGEIYNYIELRKLLLAKGYAFRTYSDTEVLLNMFIEFGFEMLNMLNGIFAFAIYNKISKKLFLGRDQFGVKPLYFFNEKNFFAFASEIKGLLAHPRVKFLINQDKLREYVVLQIPMGRDTFYNSISKLEPGHYMTVEMGKITSEKKYWDLDYNIDETKSEEEFSKELFLLLQNSTMLQVRSDVPIGSYLSGGIDSSIVSILTSNNYPDKIKTFSGGYKVSSDYDETNFANIVAKKIKSNHYEIFPTHQDFIDNFEKLVYHMDEPSGGPGIFSQYMVSKLASQHVKVVLGGHGGDELFGGYARYSIAYLEESIKGAILENNKQKYVVTLDSIIENLPSLKQYLPLIKRQFSNGLFDPMNKRYFNLINRSFHLRNLYTEEFVSSIQMDKIFSEFQNIFDKPNTSSLFNKMTYFDIKTLLPALLHIEDRVSMAVSIESRVPLLDTRIAELGASIPPIMKFSGGKLKYILIKSTQDILPKKIIDRKDKMGFPTPINDWMKGPLRDYVMDIFLSNKSRQRGIYKVENIEKQLNSEGKFTRDLWGLLNIELWHQMNQN
tara:strand:+ start:311 stop:2128 length:1818 start_codon:yes stop_codon:yes gene_type:complete